MSYSRDYVLAIIIITGLNTLPSYCEYDRQRIDSDEMDSPEITIKTDHHADLWGDESQADDDALFVSFSEKRSPQRRRGRFHVKNYEECTLTSRELLRLLVALHQARQSNGNTGQLRICNRMRPIKAIITDFRFLGRRRK